MPNTNESHVVHAGDWQGGGIQIVRQSVTCDEAQPLARGRVRCSVFVVIQLRPCAKGTQQTLAMELELGGYLPGKVVDHLFTQQSKTFGRLTRFVNTEAVSSESVSESAPLPFNPPPPPLLTLSSLRDWAISNIMHACRDDAR
jgi:hypothetical protein